MITKNHVRGSFGTLTLFHQFPGMYSVGVSLFCFPVFSAHFARHRFKPGGLQSGLLVGLSRLFYASPKASPAWCIDRVSE